MPRPTGSAPRKTGTTVIVVAVVAALFLGLVGVGVLVQAQRLASQTIFQKTLAVTVTDDRGNALSGATVSVQGSSNAATTESTGVAQLGLGSLTPGIYTLVAIDRPGYINSGIQFSIPESGNPQPVAIQMPWAPPLGTFVWRWKSTEWSVMVISGGEPDFTLQGYNVEWHCYGNDWSRSDVTVALGRDQLTFDGSNVPMGPGAISTSWVLNGSLPDTTQPAPAGTCVNGQNAW